MRALSVLILTVLASLVAVAPASAQEACASDAFVRWQVDNAELLVTGAEVTVPGCDDGEDVGLQLITDDGDVPEDDPLGAEVADEVATFDLSDLEVGVEPVTGVRVFLIVDDEPVPVPVVTIVVDQRYFNQAGNEQIGLNQQSELTAPESQGSYTVPGAPTGWEHISCEADDLDLDLDGFDDLLRDEDGDLVEGPSGDGGFPFEDSGRHLVCYQQTPGAGGPPVTDDPEVLDDAVTDETTDGDDGVLDDSDETAVRGESEERRGPVDAALALTGLDVASALTLGSGLLLVGIVAVIRPRGRAQE